MIHLKILLPFETFLDEKNVQRVVVETLNGSYGFLTKRLDCAAALSPGILFYQNKKSEDVFLALDEGVMIKKENEILISARHAFRGDQLDQLSNVVKKEFLAQYEKEDQMKFLLKKMESRLVLSLSEVLL